MDSTCRVNYYAARIFGLLPMAGDYKAASLLYTASLWTAFCSAGVRTIVYNYNAARNVSPKRSMLLWVTFIESLLGFAMSVASTAVSVTKSRGFVGLTGKFAEFDRAALRCRRPSDGRPRNFCLSAALFIGVYNLAYDAFVRPDVVFYALSAWSAMCASAMLPVVQYAAYVGMLRQRYALVNTIFTNSVSMSSTSADIGYMYPKEVNRLFIELRGLTDEVKTYYAYHAIIIIVESVLILVSSATTLTINYLNELDKTYVHNGYCIGQCALRFLFLLYVVHEAHKTILETKNTVSIGHQALSITPDATTIKYLEVIILNCWNNPIIFDVHDFFDLDYYLLQSITASVVTYVVVLVQIQLVIMDM